ncbi:hypothetical protein POTOM_044819 [Populus tomentosa]|uniref:Uncharacterized protein n=1 Tax=Populus tomentosa TaxID=118781 RepID=A0A8X7YGR3_POPTO|nr:hypothetical protein POTOM_044819 [Populus tomentosa]
MSLGLVIVTAFRVQIKEVDEDNWSGGVEYGGGIKTGYIHFHSYRNLAPLDLTGQPDSELARARFAKSSPS